MGRKKKECRGAKGVEVGRTPSTQRKEGQVRFCRLIGQEKNTHVPPAPGNQTPVQTTHLLRLGASTQIGSYRGWQKFKGVGVRSILRATLPRALPCSRALYVRILR